MLKHLLFQQRGHLQRRQLTVHSIRYFAVKPPLKPKTHQQMALETQESQKYDFKKDPRIINILKNFLIFFIIVVTSGKATGYLVNRFVLGDQAGESLEDKY